LITLALDTSSGTSVAVLRDAEVLASLDYQENMTHAERIGHSLKDVLEHAGVSASDLDRVVVGLGPGPFTGLRVGIAAAKLFSLGADVELVGVCSLDSIAMQYYQAGNSGDLLVTTDARRQEWFWAKYSELKDLVPVRVEGPSVNKPIDISEEDFAKTDFTVSAAALGQIAFHLGDRVNRVITPIYLREPDATPGKPKKVSG
jgi:tRNA threonylcarbamoyl adenosine modification protein YeaZ